MRAIERCHISKSPPEPRRVCALGEVPVDLIPDEPPHIQLLNALKQKHMCYRAVLCRHSRAFGSAGRQLVVGRQLCEPLWMLLQSNPLRSALIGQDCQRRRDQAQHRVQNESARRRGHAGRRGVMSRMSPRTWSRSTWADGWLCGPAAACVLSAPFSIDDSASRLHSALGTAQVNRPAARAGKLAIRRNRRIRLRRFCAIRRGGSAPAVLASACRSRHSNSTTSSAWLRPDAMPAGVTNPATASSPSEGKNRKLRSSFLTMIESIRNRRCDCCRRASRGECVPKRTSAYGQSTQ